MRIRSAILVLTLGAAPALACDAPDDLGGMPWRVAVARVKVLPETEAWADLMQRERNVVQYVVLLDEPKHVEGRCYWPVEIRADGQIWKRFLVTPDGKGMIEDQAR